MRGEVLTKPTVGDLLAMEAKRAAAVPAISKPGKPVTDQPGAPGMMPSPA